MVGTTRRVDHVRGVSCADRIARVLPALWASAALAAYFGAPAPVAAQPVPLSDELIVNTYTSGNQRMAELSADANGNFVIVWRSDTSPLEAAPSIRAQRFDAAAAVIGTEFEVAAPGVSPSTPGVAMTADGDFMVVWLEDEPRILARSFDADAMPRSDAFRVDTTIYDNYHGYDHGYADQKYGPDVAAGAGDRFMVVWSAGYNEYLYFLHRHRYIRAQMIGGDGGFVGTEFRAGGDLYYEVRHPDVEIDSNEEFVVAWNRIASYDYDFSGDYYQRTRNWELRARRFDSTGTASSAEVTSGAASGYAGAVAAAPGGGFIVAWPQGYYEEGFDARARRYDTAAMPLGASILVTGSTPIPNPASDAGRTGVDVGVAQGGSFVVVWSAGSAGYEDKSDGSLSGIFARTYAADGTPQGAEIAVNAYTSGAQLYPAVVFTGPETFVVTWESADRDGSQGAIVARRFARAPECGDASADAETTATDALIALSTAVGSAVCPACVCDANGSGTVTATDALRILGVAAGQPLALTCAGC